MVALAQPGRERGRLSEWPLPTVSTDHEWILKSSTEMEVDIKNEATSKETEPSETIHKPALQPDPTSESDSISEPEAASESDLSK